MSIEPEKMHLDAHMLLLSEFPLRLHSKTKWTLRFGELFSSSLEDLISSIVHTFTHASDGGLIHKRL